MTGRRHPRFRGFEDLDGFGQLAGPDAALPDAPAPPPASLCPHGCIDVLTGLLARSSHAWENLEFMLASACGRAGTWPGTETGTWHRQRRRPDADDVPPVQCGGGCEIRTREALPPTRFPSLRTCVRGR